MSRHNDPTRTPIYRITNSLRRLWMMSKERQMAMKRDKYSCVMCGVKQSKAKGREQKIEVHHKKGRIDWKAISELLRKELLVDASELECLCPVCHKKVT